MNYIENINGFWLLQENYQLGPSEISMYFKLLDIWNKTGWMDSFKRNNYKVMSDLSIKTYKTFQSTRDKLRAAGILSYKQGNGNANAEYRMVDLSKNYRGSGQGLGKGLGEGRRQVNTNHTETKLNGDYARAPEKKEEVTEAPPAPEIGCAQNFLFQDCMKIYDSFVRKRSPMGPLVDEDDDQALHDLIAYFLDEIGGDQDERAAERVKERWRTILEHWPVLDAFHHRRIRLRDIYNDLTNILTQIQNATNSQTRQGTSTSAGSGTGSAGKTSGQVPKPSARSSSIDALQNLEYDGDHPPDERAEFADAEVIG